MQLRNTTLDDLAAIIGFTATARLAAWFGGKNLYVPGEIQPDSVLASLIGMSAARRLQKEFKREWLAMPSLAIALRDSRYATICELMQKDMPLTMVATQMDMTLRRVQQLRVEFEVLGLLPPRKFAEKVQAEVERKGRGKTTGVRRG